MRWLAILVLVLLTSCSSEERLTMQSYSSGDAYDTVKDDKVPDTFQARSIYDPKNKTIDRRVVVYQTLLKGLQSVQDKGYDRAVILSGGNSALVTYVWSRSMPGPATERSRQPGFTFVIRGYKPSAEAPANAKPIAGLIEEYNRRLAAGPSADQEKLTPN